MLPEILVTSARRPSISSIDRSVAEQPGIFSKPWVLSAKAAQRVCVNISTCSRGHVELNKLHACLRQRKYKELFLKCFSLNKSDKEERKVCPLLYLNFSSSRAFTCRRRDIMSPKFDQFLKSLILKCLVFIKNYTSDKISNKL